MSDTNEPEGLPSGRFVLRIAPRLHARLRREAAEAGMSLNEYCARKLKASGPGGEGPAWEVVEATRDVFGRELVGVVAYGSWARGEAMDASDLDVLLVLEPGAEVTRERYRCWDAAAPAREGRMVEAHIVALPSEVERLTGLWAEVAVDGVVLFEVEHRLSRYLSKVRRRLLEGELVRRESHGQPYWTEVA